MTENFSDECALQEFMRIYSTLRIERRKWANADESEFDRVPRTSREFAWALSPLGAYIIFLDENMKFGGLSEFME